MAENSFWNFTPKTNSRNDYLAERNKMQALVMGAPQPMQQQQQQMPDFGAGGVALQQAKNAGLVRGLQQQALAGAGNDINGWPLAAGPNPNNPFAGAWARARAQDAAGPFRDAAAKEAHDRATGQQVWGRDQAWLGNPRTMQQIDENVARISRQDQERNGWVFPNPNGAEQYGRSLKYGSMGMLPMDYRGPGVYYAGAGPDDPYEKWQPPAPKSITTTPGFPGASYYGDVTQPTHPFAPPPEFQGPTAGTYVGNRPPWAPNVYLNHIPGRALAPYVP